MTLFKAGVAVAALILSIPTAGASVNAKQERQEAARDRGGRLSDRQLEVVIRTLEKVVREGYQDPESGALIAAELRERRKGGRYSQATSPEALTSLLTEDLREISRDLHFSVDHNAEAAHDSVPGRGGRPAQLTFTALSKEEGEFLRSQGYGLQGVERLDGNIGRIDIRAFAGPYPEVRRRYALAMEFLKDTDGLIIDLTQNGGGSVHMVAHFLSYFFDREPFLTKTIFWRTQGEERFLSAQALEGPAYGSQKPVVVAVSESTFSGGEELAYDFQTFKRGTIVGQRTKGGANPIAAYELGFGFRAVVPTGRVVNPVTGSNWEGTGVHPDIVTPPHRTLACAHEVALRKVLDNPALDAQARATKEQLLGSLQSACAA